ncbi:hypothetical protein TWF788_005007 [Orbilia oligospora]|uniref:Uncharacterized protein n=1 Tax=Orbilia oligospora TaxID=2813651 RepID=A0A7C8PZC7_ORBOL|nr:hypothetical protein TWF788_005007 [Orbilia oligospora]
MAKRQGQCLNRSQNSIVFFFIFLFWFFTDGVAAWYQLNLFKDRSDWWSRPDITSPAEILVKESSGYVCIAANRPIEDTAMDAVVIWNRPELKGTNVRAVAFYNGRNCGASPDPNTGELPLPSAILVLSLDNPYAVSAFTLASQNLKFLWGSYQAFDLRGEYHPGRILAQFVGENLSGTIILKDPNPADPTKPYKAPVRALRVLKEDQYRPLTSTVDINALMRQAGETALLSTEEMKSELVQNVTRLLMQKLLQDIATERARGEEIRRRLAATSAAAEGAFGGVMGSATSAATGSVAGSQLASDTQGSNSVNLAQTSLNNSNSMNFPLPGGQPYPGFSSNVRPGNTLQDSSQPSSQRGQQHSSHVNVRSSQGLQGNIPQYYTQDLSTPPPNTASQRINPGVSAAGNRYPPTGGTQQPITINPGQSSGLGAQSSPSNPSTARIMAEAPITESNRQNAIPHTARQGQPGQPNTYILPRQGPVPLHPDLIGALVRGDDPRILDARGVDMNGILRTYYSKPDKHKWFETFKVFKGNVDKAFAVAQQLFELGERGGVPPPGYRQNQGLGERVGGSQITERIPQTQNIPPNGSANQLPSWGQPQPRGGQYPNNEAAQVGSQPNISQQPAAFNIGPNLGEGYRPGQMQMEAPQQNSGGEQQAPNAQNRQPYEGPTSARTDTYSQIQTAPLGAGLQMEQVDSRGQPITRHQMQQAQSPAVNPNLSQGQDSYLGRIPSTQPQTILNVDPQVDLPQVPDDEQDRSRNNPQDSERRGMLVEGPGIEPLSTPGVYRLGLPTRDDRRNVPLSEPFIIGRPPQDADGTQNIPRLETEAIVASNQQNQFGGGSTQPRINNVQWMQGQVVPLRRQLAQADQPLSRSGVAPGAQNIAGKQVMGEPMSSRYPQASFNTNPSASQEPQMQEEPTGSMLPIQGQEGLQIPSNIAPEYREIPAGGQQLQQGGQSQEEYIPSPDVIFPDWGEEFVAPELDNSSNEDETELVPPTFGIATDRVPQILGQNEDFPEPSDNVRNIPVMFQRASPSNFNTDPRGQIPIQSNQHLLNRPSVGQLRPSRGGAGSSRVEQSDSSLGPSPTRDEEQQGQRINPSIEQHSNLVAATDSSEPEAEVFEASGIEEEGNQESNLGQEIIELDQRPDIFDRNQGLGPEVVPFQYIQEELTPASAQSVIDEISGDTPQLNAQQKTTSRQIDAPELNLESYPDREFQDMVRDIIWGKPSSSGINLNSLFSGRGSHILPGVRNPAINDEQLLRPPPMRRPPHGIQITRPNLKDPNVVELDLAHTYSRILSQLQQLDESQRQPNAEKIPGYMTPQFLRSLIPNPAVNPFLEEDNTPLFPSALTKSLNPDLTREQIWDRPYEYTDPMLDKEFRQQQLREEKERRENELLSDPLNAWRAQLKAMARFQQRRRPKPGDIPFWTGPQFLDQESRPRFDGSRVTTEEYMNALENPQDYHWGWGDAEDGLVVKKRKMNPS